MLLLLQFRQKPSAGVESLREVACSLQQVLCIGLLPDVRYLFIGHLRRRLQLRV